MDKKPTKGLCTMYAAAAEKIRAAVYQTAQATQTPAFLLDAVLSGILADIRQKELDDLSMDYARYDAEREAEEKKKVAEEKRKEGEKK